MRIVAIFVFFAYSMKIKSNTFWILHFATHSATQRHTAPHSATQRHTVPHIAPHRHTSPHIATHHHTPPHITTHHHTSLNTWANQVYKCAKPPSKQHIKQSRSCLNHTETHSWNFTRIYKDTHFPINTLFLLFFNSLLDQVQTYAGNVTKPRRTNIQPFYKDTNLSTKIQTFLHRYKPFYEDTNLSTKIQTFLHRYKPFYEDTNLSTQIQTFLQRYKPFYKATNLSTKIQTFLQRYKPFSTKNNQIRATPQWNFY